MQLRRPGTRGVTYLRIATIVAVFLLASCGSKASNDADVIVEWQIRPDPPEVGHAAVTVALADSTGAPLEGADVSLEGIMTHPGMAPVLVDARETAPGTYEASMELTMRGDWILLLTARLPDGRTIERQKGLRAGE